MILDVRAPRLRVHQLRLWRSEVSDVREIPYVRYPTDFSAAGRMMLQMLAVFAEFEHATIVDRVGAGIERRAKEGRW
ncbi:MAG: recombinase family protein [Actinobacteria bacterium]|nr:recombinase family protein [Actinomycetota bacterium]